MEKLHEDGIIHNEKWRIGVLNFSKNRQITDKMREASFITMSKNWENPQFREERIAVIKKSHIIHPRKHCEVCNKGFVKESDPVCKSCKVKQQSST